MTINLGDIIQVPRAALSPCLHKNYPTMFGVVISTSWVRDHGCQYMVALISDRCVWPELEMDIGEGPFKGRVVAASLIVNVLECQLEEVAPVDRKRGSLSPADRNCLRKCLEAFLLHEGKTVGRPGKSGGGARSERGERPWWSLALGVVIGLIVGGLIAAGVYEFNLLSKCPPS